MPRESDCREYQEIVAALLLPGPNGGSGWNVRELTAVCPSVQEPHRASQILYDLARHGVTRHVGKGTSSRHHIHQRMEEIHQEKWRPSRETLSDIAENREGVLAGLRDIPKGGVHVQRWIWDAWDVNPAMPLTKKQILAEIRRSHPDCQEHVVSQQLHEMVRAGKLRQHDEPGKPVAFIPVREPDLFTFADSRPQDMRTSLREIPREAAGRAAIAGILPEVSVYLGDADVDALVHDRAVRAFVALDAEGNIQSIRIDPEAANISPCV